MTAILHLSDLHFGKPARPELIEGIEELIQERRFDVVAISGDLSQRARSGELQRAQAFIRQTQRVSRTIVVPGNHDVKWWRAPVGIGNGDAPYRAFRMWIQPELEPVLRVPGVTLVGINTAHGVTRHTLTWKVRDIGVIGTVRRSQVERARREFEQSPEGDARVVVMHHNPMKGELSQRHGLRNTRRVLGAFADLGVDVVLCGHDHQEAIHYIEHTRRGTVVSTAGTVSNRSRGGRPSSVNVIDVAPEHLRVSTLVWDNDASVFRHGPQRSFPR